MADTHRTILVGDIHGCFHELQALLASVKFGPKDTLVSLGDFVDSGPQPGTVFTFLRDTPNAYALLGNHERKHRKWADKELEPALGQRLTKALMGREVYASFIEYVRSLPTYLELPDVRAVHGFWEPGLSAEQQAENVLTGVLSGQRYLEKNYTRPWYDLYDGTVPIVVGHEDYQNNGEPFVIDGRVYGIDTSCAEGGWLTGLIVPGFELVRVPAAQNYQSKMKAGAKATLAIADLPWAQLNKELGRFERRPPKTAKHRRRMKALSHARNNAQHELVACAQLLKQARMNDVDLATAARSNQALSALIKSLATESFDDDENRLRDHLETPTEASIMLAFLKQTVLSV